MNHWIRKENWVSRPVRSSHPWAEFQICDLKRSKILTTVCVRLSFETSVPISCLSRVPAEKIQNCVPGEPRLFRPDFFPEIKACFSENNSMLSLVKILKARFSCFGQYPSPESTNILCYWEFTGNFAVTIIVRYTVFVWHTWTFGPWTIYDSVSSFLMWGRISE